MAGKSLPQIYLVSIILLATGPLCSLTEQGHQCDYISKHGYPCEVHSVYTTDGYILSTVRIPHSWQGANQKDDPPKPVVFLMHGLFSSSDAWLLNGPNDGLVFMLADAGYDVWIGNGRGNVYSRKHVSLSTLFYTFWDFDWHEMGVYDLPANIDYILLETGQTSLHYVGHSLGSTVFLVWLSTFPNDNSKIKTTHLLGPIAFMSHMAHPFAATIAQFLGQSGSWINVISPVEMLARSDLFTTIAPQFCYEGSVLQEICTNFVFQYAGTSNNFNVTLLSDLIATHPAGISNREFIHYVQEYKSGHFRQFDYGKDKNIKIYNAETPADYNVGLIKTSTPIHLYYSDNDIFASVTDVHKLAHLMGGDAVELHRVQVEKFSHLDFSMAKNVKEVINNCVLSKIQRYEGESRFDNNSCFWLSTTRTS